MGVSVKNNNTIAQLTSIATFPCMICQVNLHKLSQQKCSKLEDLPIFMIVEKNRHCFTNQKVVQKLKNVKNKKHHLLRNLISQTVMFFVFHIFQFLGHFLISVKMSIFFNKHENWKVFQLRTFLSTNFFKLDLACHTWKSSY